jgi:hypothetical protein
MVYVKSVGQSISADNQLLRKRRHGYQQRAAPEGGGRQAIQRGMTNIEYVLFHKETVVLYPANRCNNSRTRSQSTICTPVAVGTARGLGQGFPPPSQ